MRVSHQNKCKLEMIATVYGDDIIILSDELDGINWAKAELKWFFMQTDLGPLQCYLGVSFLRMRNVILLCLEKYVQNILNHFWNAVNYNCADRCGGKY